MPRSWTSIHVPDWLIGLANHQCPWLVCSWNCRVMTMNQNWVIFFVELWGPHRSNWKTSLTNFPISISRSWTTIHVPDWLFRKLSISLSIVQRSWNCRVDYESKRSPFSSYDCGLAMAPSEKSEKSPKLIFLPSMFLIDLVGLPNHQFPWLVRNSLDIAVTWTESVYFGGLWPRHRTNWKTS